MNDSEMERDVALLTAKIKLIRALRAQTFVTVALGCVLLLLAARW